ncbi:hypothetical protein ACVWW1_006256 [Bradyrhizobium sp. JR3.5]
MTCIDKIDPAASHAAVVPSRELLTAELAETLKLAVPLALTQLGLRSR